MFDDLCEAPANEAIEYEIRTFSSSSAQEPTIYLGPPDDKVDKAWEDIYGAYQRTRIDGAEAARLPNQTASITNDPGHYLITIDVFHQLHCLDFVRKRLYPSRYDTVADLAKDRNGSRALEIEHTGMYTPIIQTMYLIRIPTQSTIEHCIDSIRQSLQCSADVTPVLYKWDGYVGEIKGDARTIHTCRNFTKIQEWAATHSVKE
ncbi:uncharacterized protein Z520_07157 [Fonsecaea multimorphosa CBS 102226]|uniref:Uncharacterized protein n=1 Tax=Fonsecaea multimorphosa CBS 102226 TaxID=1442371 RepID=A0A0D2KK92_9EURO|nr:uncharacterized protein Z520_07157 [Fonsecaea multimorphosa CBS 102226]KIX97043.1 hypothetical protein Z520_07157 [Fonsecaea multimorphosa CBS 102226]